MRTPGPMVELSVTLRTYVPFADEGFAFIRAPKIASTLAARCASSNERFSTGTEVHDA